MVTDSGTVPVQDPTSPTSPVATFPPIPPEKRSRAKEFYGFVAWSSTFFLYWLYIAWALLPDEWIVWFGVTWYPNREWSILIPAYSCVLVLLTYFTYFALALAGTPSFSDTRTITDSRGIFTADAHTLYAQASPDAIPEMYDIPISVVNRVLYGNRDGAEKPPRER